MDTHSVALTFRAPIEIYNGNPYVLVTAPQAAELKEGWRKPMPVKVQINGRPKPAWRINMMPIGDGSFYLYLHGEVRTASKTKVGDEVEVLAGLFHHVEVEVAGGQAIPKLDLLWGCPFINAGSQACEVLL